MREPLVSVITIFLDEERFLGEAVESVLSQTYVNWELLLCDDGSTDGSTGLARGFAARHPDRIRYLEHPGHRNQGMSATRNLGLEHARGELVAFLDGDDVWLPDKLELQVSSLAEHPRVGLAFGPSLYWHSWTGRAEDRVLDGMSRLPTGVGTASGQRVLTRILRGRGDAVCTCSILARTERVRRVGGFEKRFTGLFEDQAFMSKFLIENDVLVVGECTDRYRQHPDSCCAVAERSGESADAARVAYLRWLRSYLEGRDVRPLLRVTVALELALQRAVPGSRRFRERWRERRRNMKGYLVSLSFSAGRFLLPEGVRKRLWRSLVDGSGEA